MKSAFGACPCSTDSLHYYEGTFWSLIGVPFLLPVRWKSHIKNVAKTLKIPIAMLYFEKSKFPAKISYWVSSSFWLTNKAFSRSAIFVLILSIIFPMERTWLKRWIKVWIHCKKLLPLQARCPCIFSGFLSQESHPFALFYPLCLVVLSLLWKLPVPLWARLFWQTVSPTH